MKRQWLYRFCSIEGGDAGGGAAPAPAAPAAPSAAPPAPAAPAAPSAAPAIDWSTAPAHFRTAYDKLKTDHEAFTKEWGGLKELGGPADLQRGYTVANQMYQEMTTLATAQGYKQQEIDEAFDKDPVGVLAFLRQEAAKKPTTATGNTNPDGSPLTTAQIEQRIKDGIEQATQPLNDWHNQQLAEAGNNRFTAEFNKLFTDAFKQYGADIPAEFRQDVYDVTSELMRLDPEALNELKLKGSVAAVGKYFAEAQKFVTRIYTHMTTLEGRRTSGGAGGTRGPDGKFAVTGNTSTKKVSLDDIISGKIVDEHGHIRA